MQPDENPEEQPVEVPDDELGAITADHLTFGMKKRLKVTRTTIRTMMRILGMKRWVMLMQRQRNTSISSSIKEGRWVKVSNGSLMFLLLSLFTYSQKG